MNQEQKATDSGVAIQSGGNTNINVGISSAEIQSIIKGALESVAPLFKEMATSVAIERMKSLEEKLLSRFTAGNDAAPEALKDPDFQYLLVRAHHAYARSGEPVVADTLVDLIALRSRQPQRSRLSLSLNEAVDKTAVLTSNEFSTLSLVYYLRYTQRIGLKDFTQIVADLRLVLAPLMPQVDTRNSALTYLVAQNCATIEITSVSFVSMLKHAYAGHFSKGFEMEELKGKIPAEHQEKILARLVVPCRNDHTRYQFAAQSKDDFISKMKEEGFDETLSNQLWNSFERTLWTEEEFLQKAEAIFPEIRELKKIWTDSQIKNMTLTPIGIAIGYANLKRTGNFNASLSIWIE